jgi:hypothetical protein
MTLLCGAVAVAFCDLTASTTTQIQEHTTALCAHFFNFTGALQRDAPPLGLDGGALLAQAPPTAAQLDTVSKIPQMAEQVGMFRLGCLLCVLGTVCSYLLRLCIHRVRV